jgi:predicted nucleic acid-binding protein
VRLNSLFWAKQGVGRGLYIVSLNAVMVSPDMVSYEIANALTKMMKKKVIEKERMINAFTYFKRIPIKTIEIDIVKALGIAWEYKIYAYDACYLESAKRLNLPLLTFDANMIKVGKELGINILGGKNVGI